MDLMTNKNKALSKKETKGLLSLIERSTIINSKNTLGNSNRLKRQEWARITDIFNKTIGTFRRTPRQLRLKWENLKKNSRRRNALIRMEQIKNGNGPTRYFPPDEILDHVTTLLESTREGFNEFCGGDAKPQNASDCSDENRSQTSMSSLDTSLPVMTKKTIDNTVSANSIRDEIGANTSTPMAIPYNSNLRFSAGFKCKMKSADDGRYARNIALAEYYKAKKKILDCQLETMKIDSGKINLDNEKLKLENENLKLENEKLKLELKILKGGDS
ncbi:hypothetical protein O3G_MSEX014228 [Manduca sexta]|uniref:Regulatory protein zeste n=1 Tax=Manduca sexta TaxID=7130 RepID=A0A921ZVK8_MANSE|nr:hypothetical protein O3G_MSEX014228 [Manduca sexta]KAG6464019.1 hypothetical protein O3G_MSEX014228 [Manduca sexta]